MMFAWLTESRLYHLARQGARLPHWLAVLPLFFALTFGAGFLSELVGVGLIAVGPALSLDFRSILRGVEQSLLASAFSMSLILILPFITVSLVIWLWIKFYEKRSFSTLGFEKNNALLQYGRGLLIGAALFGGAVGLMVLLGFVEPRAGDLAHVGLPALGSVLLVFLGWVAQGATEEILTRGWLLPVLSVRARPWIGIAVASLLFALLHGLNPNISVLALINLALFGLFASFYALREGSLWGICAVHSVWNWIQGNVFGFEVSGLLARGGALFKFVATGPDWFTGGAFGPEGGLAVSIMLVVGVVAVLVWPRASSVQPALEKPASPPLP